jgi:hypothetical protein
MRGPLYGTVPTSDPARDDVGRRANAAPVSFLKPET